MSSQTLLSQSSHLDEVECEGEDYESKEDSMDDFSECQEKPPVKPFFNSTEEDEFDPSEYDKLTQSKVNLCSEEEFDMIEDEDETLENKSTEDEIYPNNSTEEK